MSDSGLNIGRRIKATRIAEQIRALGGVGSDLAGLTDQEWMGLDWLSRGRKDPKRPVSPETRALVLAMFAAPALPDPGEPSDEDVP